MAALLRLGIDTGGTFTDVVWRGPQGRGALKLASTPGDPAEAVLAGIAAAAGDGVTAALHVHHGTTVGTNAVLTRGGARVAFITTSGFEDLLHVGRGQRDDLHALTPARTAPLVERRRCVGLVERVGATGDVVRAPTRKALADASRALRGKGADAVAVCLLHAPRNDGHERALAEALEGAHAYVYTSAEASADTREFERATTTVLHAYVAPLVAAYTDRLAEALPDDALTILRSDGGRMSPADVRAAPARTLLSGPAAGVSGARELARAHGLQRVLTFDVGGTSTDVAWIEDAEMPVGPELRVGDFTAGLTSASIETVGAGGGSIVRIDAGGALCVGPESAGAVPGPACYGQGGPFALTDAWLLLDRIPSALLAGDFPLDRRAARDAARQLADEAGMSVPALCRGAVEVAAATTARALRLASAAQGRDPGIATLVAFGGAGPGLACDTAAHLGIRTVLVPPEPGVFAARGALYAPLTADAEQVAPRGARAMARGVKRLEAAVRERLTGDGATAISVSAEVDARYAGQAFEVTVPYAGWEERFHERHSARYGFADPERAVQAVRLRVRGEGSESAETRSRTRHVTPVPRRRAPRVARGGGGVAAIDRARLEPGMRITGPLRVDERSGTTFVPMDWRVACLGDGSLELSRSRR